MLPEFFEKDLKNHIPLHTKDEVYECPYCPKQYYVKYSYDKHIKSHIVAPKFNCAICNKHFTLYVKTILLNIFVIAIIAMQ